MAHRQFLIRYSNGFKKHVSQADLDLLGKKAQQTGPREYFCHVDILQQHEITSGPSYLDLQLIFEKPPDREYEREQTPRGMLARLEEMGFTAEERAA